MPADPVSKPDAKTSRTKPVRVALFVNGRKDEAVRAAASIRRLIDTHATLVGEHEVAEDGKAIEDRPDLAIVLGGDGTILGLAKHALHAGVAVLGINFGKLGFLAEFSTDAFEKHAAEILSGNATIREVAALDVRVVRNGQELARHTAINDVAVCNGAPFRMIELGLSIDHAPANDAPRVAGDGLIVATPTGSTAYNAAAGGPILEPTLPAMVVTPIAAHSLSFRPIVVPATSAVDIHALRVNEPACDGATSGTAAVIDGQQSIGLHKGDIVRITVAGNKLRLVVNPERSYWQTLIHKLRWASTPGR